MRQEGSRIWVYTDAHEGDAIPRIAAIGCELRLEEAFAKVLLGEENADLRQRNRELVYLHQAERVMEAKRAARILRALADGTDPFTGEVVEDRGPLQNLECIRALFAAVEVLEGRASTQNRRDRENHGLTNRVGKPWHEREDEELTERIDAGWNVADLAKHHQRTQVAIRARLVRLGKIANRRDA